MIEYLPEMQQAGIHSLKIEGRMKTPLYIAMVTKVYREALDDLKQSEALYRSKITYYKSLLEKVSHRGYTTGFYLGPADRSMQNYSSSAYVKDIDFIGMALDEATEPGWVKVEQRGKFSVGETIYLLSFRGEDEAIPLRRIVSEEGEDCDSAPHAQEHVRILLPQNAERPAPGTVFYRFRGDENS